MNLALKLWKNIVFGYWCRPLNVRLAHQLDLIIRHEVGLKSDNKEMITRARKKKNESICFLLSRTFSLLRFYGWNRIYWWVSSTHFVSTTIMWPIKTCIVTRFELLFLFFHFFIFFVWKMNIMQISSNSLMYLWSVTLSLPFFTILSFR